MCAQIFIITTDGYENASRKFNKEQIKEMIQGHKKWEFMYIEADIDSYSKDKVLVQIVLIYQTTKNMVKVYQKCLSQYL